ncbi:MAG TPA: NrfD/PsrC family molybdoenzyme membrane anchor subunit [bacterium]|nr:NrfD/PsrC family molybdoenzyme membrane anchor subunit [bacterium]
MKTYFRFWKEMVAQALKGSALYWIWLVVLTAIVIMGGFAYAEQVKHGLIVSNLSDQVAWGAYIANFTYIVGVAASAILLMIPAYFYRIELVKQITIIGELFAVCAVSMGMLFVVVDIGRPDRFWHLMPGVGRVNWPMSILSWDVLLLSGYLLLALYIPFYLLYQKYIKEEPRGMFFKPLIYLSIFWAAIPVTAFLFSGLGSRQYWNSAVMAPRFLTSSFIAGPSLMLLVLYIIEWRDLFEVPRTVIRVLIRIVALALILNLFLFASEVFKEFYTGALESASARYLFFGLKGKHMLVPYTWLSIGLNLVATIIFASHKLSSHDRLIQIASVFAVVGIWIEKGMGMVVPGFVPSPLGDIIEYTPSWVEVRVCAGIWAFGFLSFTLLMKAALPIERGDVHYGRAIKEHPAKSGGGGASGLTKPVVTALVLLAALLGAGSTAEAKTPFHISGWIMQDYHWKTTGAFSDHLAETLVTLNFGDPVINRFSGSIQGGVIVDLNKQDSGSPYRSIYDTFGSHAIGRFYYGYLDVNKVGLFSNIRAGRQHLYELEGLHFDGLSVETKPYAGFVVSAFGGVPVHLYENQFGFDPGDWTAGGALQWTPIARLRFRFSGVHLRDKVSAFRIFQGNLDDTLFGGAAWLNITPNWELYSRVTAFTDQLRDLDFGSSTSFPKQDLKLTVTAHRLLEAYDFRVNELDPFSFAGTYQPYTEAMAQIYKGFGKKFGLVVGGGMRLLDHNQVASAFNHGFAKAYGSFTTRGFLAKGLSSTLTADYYRGRDNTLKNNYFGLSFSVNQEFMKKRLVVGAGTAFYLYRFNLFTGDESSDVRTYFGEIEGRIRKDLKLKAGYEFEKNRINGFHSGRVRLVWDF